MVIINGRFLEKKLKGIGRFAYSLSQSILNKDIGVKIVTSEIAASILKTKKEIKFGYFHGHIWEQFELLEFLKKTDNPLLLNFANTGPVFYKNQITTIHDISYVKFESAYKKSFSLFYNFIIPRIIKNSRKIITVSEFSKKEIIQHFHLPASKVHVVYNFVSPQFLTLIHQVDEQIKEKFILTVSSINPRKNFVRLIKAFLAANIPDLKLYIIGSYNPIFKTEIIKTDSQNIKFLGYINDKDLVKYYKNALFFIYPSLYEGFGIPIIEAMAANCPVAASDIPVFNEIADNSFCKFDPYNIYDMADKIKFMYQNQKFREELIQKGKFIWKKFSLEKSTQRLYEIIRENE